jgi:hypothetical protein
VEVYWHTSGDAGQVQAAAARVLDYIVSLGANSVALSFPFYTDGSAPTRVYTTQETPSVQTLGIVVDAAKARGLDVMIRPVLDEGNVNTLKGQWRGSIAPPTPSAWFASYQTFLTPYLQLAQAKHVAHFVIGTELVSLADQTTLWRELVAHAAGIYSGELSYADNWDSWSADATRSPVPVTGLDAYPQLDLGDSATLEQLTSAWTSFLRSRSTTTLEHTVIQEIGIAATSGAYKKPYLWGTSTVDIQPQIQRNWFTAACQSAKTLKMAGIYFWSVDSNATLAGAPTAPSGSFMDRSDAAIKGCFATGWT